MNLDDLLKSIRDEDDDSKGGKDLDDLLESIRSEEKTSTINPAKFFDNDEYDDYYKELVDEGSIDDQNLSEEERQRGIAAFRSNKLDFKKFVTDIQSLKPEVEQLNQEPLTIGEQSFTAPKIEPSKLIPSKDVEISEEFNEKLDELIAVIKEDNKLEEERKKFENRENQREKRKNRENRIENKKRTKLFSIDLKKGTGRVSNFFDDLKRFLTFAVLGGLVQGLYNFIMNPENNEKIEATQKFLRENWPILLGAAAYVLTPLGGLVNFLVKTVGGFALRLGALMIKHPLLSAALLGAAGAAASAARNEEYREQLNIENDESIVTPSEFIESRKDDDPSNDETPSAFQLQDEMVRQRGFNMLFSGGGQNMGTDTVPAMLTPGEIVINKPTVDGVGADHFLTLNKLFGGPSANRPKVGKIVGYARGGIVGDNPPQRDQSLLASNISYGGDINLSHGGIPAQATNQSIRDAISRALAKPGEGQTASSELGRMQTSLSGNFYLSGTFGSGNDKPKPEQKKKKKKKKKEEEMQYDPDNPKHRLKSEILNERAARQAELDKRNKFITKRRYAVPTGSGGRFNASQASGENQVSPFKPVRTNKTGGRDFERLIIIGDPKGPGSTGRVIGEKRYDKLFGPGGTYAPDMTGTGEHGTGNRQLVPDNIGKPYAGSKMEMRIQNYGFQSSIKNTRPVSTPNIPTETRNFMLPPMEVSSNKPNMGNNQSGDVPSFSISSGNRMRDLVSQQIGIHDLVGVG